MEPKCSLLHSQQSATCPCLEPDQSVPCLHLSTWRSVIIYIHVPSRPYSAEVNNAWSLTSALPYAFFAWWLFKDRSNLKLFKLKRKPAALNYIIMYIIGKICLRHHDLLNYRTNLSKTEIFRKCMIWHWWQFPFVFIDSLSIFLTKKANVKMQQCCSSGDQGKLNIFHVLPLASA